MPQLLDGLEWGTLDYLLVTVPAGTGSMARVTLDGIPTDGTVAVVPDGTDPDEVRTGVRTLTGLGSTVLGVARTVSDADAAIDPGATRWAANVIDAVPSDLGAVPVDPDRLEEWTDEEEEGRRWFQQTTADDAPAGTEVSRRDPYDRLAVGVTDRVGVVNRQSVAGRQHA